ncbi:interferon regulatory factor 4-like isoform X2 [Dendropsophus ebraccatus]|uniref:interferon regulatory factor 4-like isoform X2 n=1 Tax=Dendropsophus ebraccatus TaxID=150705 RepID=UPI0038314A5A
MWPYLSRYLWMMGHLGSTLSPAEPPIYKLRQASRPSVLLTVKLETESKEMISFTFHLTWKRSKTGEKEHKREKREEERTEACSEELDDLGCFGQDMNERGTPPLRLKEWLILQIESGKYPGLQWENEEKTMFRIPWKHAAKHNYREEEDAALFRAWAMHKGKYREGAMKEDPSVWKTRLRCALNKSPDFQEVTEYCEDFSEPYKRYCIMSEPHEASKEANKNPRKEEPPRIPMVKTENKALEGLLKPHGFTECLKLKSPNSPMDGGGLPSPINLSGQNHDQKVADLSKEAISVPPTSTSSDYWLHVRLYYQGKLVTEVTTQTAEGCRIIPLPSPDHEHVLASPCPLQDIPLPPPQKLHGVLSLEMQLLVKKLLLHLDKGVVLWVAPEGVYIKRQCQVRVYWSGPLAPNIDQPNKLEREKTCKVLDTERFMYDLKMYVMNKGPEPQYQIQLCFGEEYPGSTLNPKKLITAYVEPVFARELLINAKTKLRKSPPNPHPDPARKIYGLNDPS